MPGGETAPSSPTRSPALPPSAPADRPPAALLALPYLVAAGWVALLFYTNISRDSFRFTREDGPLEWGTIAFFGLAAALAVAAAAASRVPMSRRQRAFLVVFALVCLAAIGEELSWAQRIFGFSPPKMAPTSVLQVGHRDTAVHNLTVKTQYFQFSIGGILFGGVLLAGLVWHGVWVPLAMRRAAPRTQGVVRSLGLFVPPLDLGILVSCLVLLVIRGRWYRHTEPNEFKELIVPFVYCFMLARVFFGTREKRDLAVSASLVLITVAWLAGSAWHFAFLAPHDPPPPKRQRTSSALHDTRHPAPPYVDTSPGASPGATR